MMLSQVQDVEDLFNMTRMKCSLPGDVLKTK